MTDIGSMVERLTEAGCDPKVAAQVAAEAFAAGLMATQFQRNSSGMRLEKIRAYDRERKQNIQRNSSGIPAEPTENEKSALSLKEDKNKKERERQHATRIPAEWRPTSDEEAFASQQGLPIGEIAREAEKFRDYWHAKAGTQGRKLDWPATWRNWIRRVCEDRGFAPASATGPPNKEFVPGPGLPTDAELRAKYAERNEGKDTQGIAAEGEGVLSPSMGIRGEKPIGNGRDCSRERGVQKLGEILPRSGLAAFRNPDD